MYFLVRSDPGVGLGLPEIVKKMAFKFLPIALEDLENVFVWSDLTLVVRGGGADINDTKTAFK